MKTLFLLLSCPDLSKNSNLYSDLVKQYASCEDDVFVVAPSDNGEATHVSVEKGIEILRVRTLPLFGVNSIRKGIANVLLPYQFERAIKKFYSHIKFDRIIIPTPPITLEKVVSKLKRKFGSEVYLILRDIFPQNAVDLGMMSQSSLMYKTFRKQENRLYALSDHIGCMSQGNIDYIRKHNPEVSPDKLHILMNFQKISAQDEKQFDDMKVKYGLDGKFVMVFGGNIGVPQKIENVLAFAKQIQDKYTDAVLLLIGAGTQMDKIRSMAEPMGITNIVFKNKIPRDDYQQLVQQCDLGLISLNEKFTIPNIPSKTMAYFEASLPVLASIDAATDYGLILDEHEMGLWSLAGDTAAMVHNFELLYKNPQLRQQMGANGRKFLEDNMSVEKAYEVISSRWKKK